MYICHYYLNLPIEFLIFMTTLHFHIHYKTVLGEQLAVRYLMGHEDEATILLMRTLDGEHWSASLEVDTVNIKYQYSIISESKAVKNEWGDFRVLSINDVNNIFLEDQWRARDVIANSFLSSAFREAIFKREVSEDLPQYVPQSISFVLKSGKIPPHLSYGVIGNIPELGEWKKPIILSDAHYPVFETVVEMAQNNVFIEYKYVILDSNDASIILWEDGNNRSYHYFVNDNSTNLVRLYTNDFRNTGSDWRGAGLAVPIFSLRSQQGMGIGEFLDLKPLVDWSDSLGMKMIQVLPVNDTIANKTWQDSYPYAAISVFALHPLYVNVKSIAPFKLKKHQKDYENSQKELNDLEYIDFERVLVEKMNFLNILFEQEYGNFLETITVKKFIIENEAWLKPYAVFCHLRDINNASNFNLWADEFKKFNAESINEFYNSRPEIKKACDFYIFVQYHADNQLLEARDYARSKGIALKGDLPIGIYRHSSDAWVAPHLYNMDEQAGAPPDDFAVLGQNWGFPTYNWEVMSQDNFDWWRKRMQKLSRYFDALRIDHILGFFRIWQIPLYQVQGTLGLFNPRLPYTREELAQYGIYGDLTRFTLPYITPERLRSLLGQDVEDAMDTFMSIDDVGRIVFKSTFDTQQKVDEYIKQNPKYESHKNSLLNLLTEVLLIEEPNSQGQLFNPRITLNTTYSYSQLDGGTQHNILRLYNEYYFNRHEEYWKGQAYWKLPAIIDASNMLICAEDLGMIPKSVPQVLKDLNIMTLEIQRMPKGSTKYGQTRDYPYFSVCSPSCHDMSTIRGWWEDDHDNAKNYFYNYLHWQGIVPMSCESHIVEAIVSDHMSSPSILAIFPIQDLIGMDDALKKPNAASEQINEPSNPKHYWRYRFHMPVEDLKEAVQLNVKIKNIVKRSGR